MKRIYLTFAACAAVATGWGAALSVPSHTVAAASLTAAPSMTFRTSAGESRSISAQGLVMTFDEGVLTASAGAETLQIPTADLVSMEFTEDAPSSVEGMAADPDGSLDAWRSDGTHAGRFTDLPAAFSSLPAGVYILTDAKGNSMKITLK